MLIKLADIHTQFYRIHGKKMKSHFRILGIDRLASSIDGAI